MRRAGKRSRMLGVQAGGRTLFQWSACTRTIRPCGHGYGGLAEGLDLLLGDQADLGGDLRVQEGWSGAASLCYLLDSVIVAPLPPPLAYARRLPATHRCGRRAAGQPRL